MLRVVRRLLTGVRDVPCAVLCELCVCRVCFMCVVCRYACWVICDLSVGRSLLSVVCCLLCVVCWSVFAVRRVLYVVWNVFFVRSALCVIRRCCSFAAGCSLCVV